MTSSNERHALSAIGRCQWFYEMNQAGANLYIMRRSQGLKGSDILSATQHVEVLLIIDGSGILCPDEVDGPERNLRYITGERRFFPERI